MKISAVMAAYNGEEYIKEQIDSIVSQLGENDELIISDDNSSDSTPKIIADYSEKDPRVKCIKGRSKGVCANFENAIQASSGDVVFLCDQDDVWLPNKVSAVLGEIGKGADVVLHDARVVNKNLEVLEPSFFSMHNSRTGSFSNIVRNSFVGCCMAFKADLKDIILPFPDDIPMHDQWIGLLALQNGRNVKFLSEPLILYRRHGKNVTGGAKNSPFKMFMLRFALVRDLAKRNKEIKNKIRG